MSRARLPQFATGNHLLEGDSVYFTASGDWSRDLREAALAVGPEAAADLLERAQAFPDAVVGVYLADALLDADGRACPAHFRETFRMRGPSNRPEHARGAAAAEA
jgi:hypothetical protein